MHLECNFGDVFPVGWVWAQGCSEGLPKQPPKPENDSRNNRFSPLTKRLPLPANFTLPGNFLRRGKKRVEHVFEDVSLPDRQTMLETLQRPAQPWLEGIVPRNGTRSNATDDSTLIERKRKSGRSRKGKATNAKVVKDAASSSTERESFRLKFGQRKTLETPEGKEMEAKEEVFYRSEEQQRASFVLTGGKFVIGPVTTNSFVLAYRSPRLQWHFRTTDLDNFEIRTRSYRQRQLSLVARSGLQG
jgi:hypothetical protein